MVTKEKIKSYFEEIYIDIDNITDVIDKRYNELTEDFALTVTKKVYAKASLIERALLDYNKEKLND